MKLKIEIPPNQANASCPNKNECKIIRIPNGDSESLMCKNCNKKVN
jgi:hypothetical protein